MYAKPYTHIYPKNDPNLGKYSIHGAYGQALPMNFAKRQPGQTLEFQGDLFGNPEGNRRSDESN